MEIEYDETIDELGKLEFLPSSAFPKIEIDDKELYGYVTYSNNSVEPIKKSLSNLRKITKIPHRAYENRNDLISAYINLDIDSMAFLNCKNLETVYIGNGTKEIGDLAFCGCENLKSLYIPGSVNKIGAHAFSNCENLSIIIEGSKLEVIREYAFNGCKKLNKIDIPNSVTHVRTTILSHINIPVGKKLYIDKNCKIEYDGKSDYNDIYIIDLYKNHS